MEMMVFHVFIKSTMKIKEKLMLMDCCKDKEFDRIIMNELMYKFKKHAMLHEDVGWIPHSDVE